MQYPEFHLAPSILAADFFRLGEQMTELETAGCKAVHIDVMDGSFVPQISFGAPLISSIRKRSSLFFDVHMMVEEPARMIAQTKEAGADLMTVHAEACRHLDRTLEDIHTAGMMTGVALNPATPLSVLDYVLDKTDMVLIMTVNPGFGGQAYIPSMTRKITELREKLIKAGCPDLPIEVDGGIRADNVRDVQAAGATAFVAGSAVFGKNISEQVSVFRELLGEL